MKIHDVLDKLITGSPFDEATRTEMHAAVAEHHADDIEALSDEEKSVRPAPINKLAASAPSIFAGGLSQAQVDDMISRAIAKHDADKEAKVSTATPATAATTDEPEPTVQ